jgi:hypothetical protein
MDLSSIHCEIDAIQDLVPSCAGVKIADLEQRFGLGHACNGISTISVGEMGVIVTTSRSRPAGPDGRDL